MSGIVGVFFRDGRPVERELLQRMADRIAHRGPDGAGVWHDGPVGLGHRMLWATPESLHETLPLVDDAAGLAITADARIDNREDLIRALALGDRPVAQLPDSALILHAYARWGERCPEHLLGDFAFAIWDRNRRRLLAARDSFGVKPFYHMVSPRAVVFASEIQAFWEVPEIPRRLDERRIAEYLADRWEDLEHTFYAGIQRLPPGQTLTVEATRVVRHTYWAPDPTRQLRGLTDAEYAQAFRARFVEAVRCRVRGPDPIGVTLSGGLDSSAIVGVARRFRPLVTVSAMYPDIPESDERPFIEAVLAQGGCDPSWVRADRLEPLAEAEAAFFHEDEPAWAPNLAMYDALYRAARAQGACVLLDGIDGDTTVSHGFVGLADRLRAGRWGVAAAEATRLSRHFPRSSATFLWRYGIRPALRAVIRSSPRAASLEQAAHAQHLRRGVLVALLELLDKHAARLGLDLRHPFCDRRLVEFCLALPPEQKLQHGYTRLIMRRALAGDLPESVRWRGGKAGPPPHGRQVFSPREQRVVEGLLSEEFPRLRAAYQRWQRRGRMQDAQSVWTAAALALWLRRRASHTPRGGDPDARSGHINRVSAAIAAA